MSFDIINLDQKNVGWIKFKGFTILSPQQYAESIKNFSEITSVKEQVEYLYEFSGFADLYRANCYIIEGQQYWFGIPDPCAPEASSATGHLTMAIFVNRDFGKLSEPIRKRLEEMDDIGEITDFVNFELSHIKETVDGHKENIRNNPTGTDLASKAFLEGYRSERIGLPLKTGFEVTPAVGYELAKGAMACRLEQYLRRELKSLIAIKEAELLSENLHTLTTVPSKLLYIKYSGLYKGVKEISLNRKGEFIQRKAARILAHIMNETAANIKTLMGSLEHFNPGQTSNTVYKTEAVEQAINALSEHKFDTAELEDILSQLSN